MLEELGLLAHPHTSAGRAPTDAGYRYYVDRLLPEPARGGHVADARAPRGRRGDADDVRDAGRRSPTCMSIVSAPPIQTTTIRHIEVLLLQPQVLMVVIITSTGGVSKRVFTFERPVDAGLADWAASYLNEALVGKGLGARTLRSRLTDPTLPPTERTFLEGLVARVHRPRRHGRGLALRRGHGAAAGRAPLPGRLPAQRAARHARAPRLAARACSRRRSTSATSTCASAARTRRPRCTGCRWSPPTTACRSATSAPCR